MTFNAPRHTAETLAAAPDGRRERSVVSRGKIVAAMLDLCREGQIEPSAEAVAERAGVGRRTVFRHFDDMETLYAEMHKAMVARIEVIFRKPIDGATWHERLTALIARRIAFFEEILPVKTAADAHRARSPFLQSEHARTTRLLRDMLRFVVPADLVSNAPAFETLDLALSFEAWRRLRHEQALTVADATAVVRRMVASVVEQR
jgi:AcrR family transcriptional regulator